MSSLEMQACGLPVIASDCQGVPETIAPLSTGLVVKAGDAEALADAMIRMADRPDERDEWAQRPAHESNRRCLENTRSHG